MSCWVLFVWKMLVKFNSCVPNPKLSSKHLEFFFYKSCLVVYVIFQKLKLVMNIVLLCTVMLVVEPWFSIFSYSIGMDYNVCKSLRVLECRVYFFLYAFFSWVTWFVTSRIERSTSYANAILINNFITSWILPFCISTR